jgi:hypothetical protein
VTIAQRTDDDLPEIFVDEEKLRRTLVNLVVNAVKFSPADSTVTIDVRKTDNGGVVFNIIDEGPGLTADEVSNLFARFKQGHQGQRSDSKGFGLGLNIVKELVALNLGQISIQSVVGKGSTFSVTVPSVDLRTITGCFIERVAERGGASVTAIMVEPFDGQSEDDLQRFLSSCLFPNDVQVRRDGYPVIVIGESNNPQRWISRLQEVAADRQRLNKNSTAQLAVQLLGTWALSDAQRRLDSLLCTETQLEVEGHAEISSHCG